LVEHRTDSIYRTLESKDLDLRSIGSGGKKSEDFGVVAKEAFV